MSIPDKKKIVYIVSGIDKALAFEWIVKHLNKKKYDLSFVLLNSQKSLLEKALYDEGIKTKRIYFKSKKNYPRTFAKLIKTLYVFKPDIIHCHMLDASLLGLLAGKILNIKIRITTRHFSTYHHEYHPKAVKIDKFINWLATNIIAISKVVEKTLIEKENVKPIKVSTIPHGFRLGDFEISNSNWINMKTAELNLHTKYPVVGCISRYTHLKGLQYTIPAFFKILAEYPKAHLILANAKGDYASNVKDLLDQLPKENYTELDFEPNITALYHLFDVFVHVPINPDIEAFGQPYVEALAAGVPSVFTLSGIAHEFIEHKENAIVVSYKNCDEISEGIRSILSNEPLKNKLIKNGKISATNSFSIEKMISGLESIYNNKR